MGGINTYFLPWTSIFDAGHFIVRHNSKRDNKTYAKENSSGIITESSESVGDSGGIVEDSGEITGDVSEAETGHGEGTFWWKDVYCFAESAIGRIHIFSYKLYLKLKTYVSRFITLMHN